MAPTFNNQRAHQEVAARVVAAILRVLTAAAILFDAAQLPGPGAVVNKLVRPRILAAIGSSYGREAPLYGPLITTLSVLLVGSKIAQRRLIIEAHKLGQGWHGPRANLTSIRPPLRLSMSPQLCSATRYAFFFSSPAANLSLVISAVVAIDHC